MGVSAAWAAAAVAGGSAIDQNDRSRKQMHAAQDQQREADKVDAQAAQSSNARLAMRRRALANNALAVGQSAATTTSAGGRATLGGT